MVVLTKLDENSSTPLYAQVMAAILTSIDNGTYKPGDRIPSEEKLIEAYSVSRITVRRAIRELVEDGRLVKRTGKGTYVSEPQVKAKFTQNNDVSSFTNSCAQNGMLAGAHLISLDVVSGIDAEREFFGFGSEGKLLRIDRVRTADGVPIMVEENYYPYDTYRFLENAGHENTSLFATVFDHVHMKPSLKEPCTLDIEKASTTLAANLDVACGEPLFLYVGRYYDDNGDAMYLGKQHIVGSRFTFRI